MEISKIYLSAHAPEVPEWYVQKFMSDYTIPEPKQWSDIESEYVNRYNQDAREWYPDITPTPEEKQFIESWEKEWDAYFENEKLLKEKELEILEQCYFQWRFYYAKTMSDNMHVLNR